MKTKTALLILLLTLTFSCNKKNNTTEFKAIKLDGLTLNNNQKWNANKETHIGMNRIDSILKNNTTLDPKIIGEALSKQTGYIIKSCNMTGEAHHQLHVVLVPILETIGDLKEAQNNSELEKKTKTLQQLTTTYFNFFKI